MYFKYSLDGLFNTQVGIEQSSHAAGSLDRRSLTDSRTSGSPNTRVSASLHADSTLFYTLTFNAFYITW